jgi:hypothetical protein
MSRQNALIDLELRNEGLPVTQAACFRLLAVYPLLCAPSLHAVGSSGTLDTIRLAAVGFILFCGCFMGNIFPAAFEVVSADTRASTVGFLNIFGAMVSGYALLFGRMWRQTVGIERSLAYTALAYLLVALLLSAGITWLFRRDYERIH